MANRRYGESDTKVLLAQGLAIQKTELTAAMVYLGGTEVIHDGADLPVHGAWTTDPERQAEAGQGWHNLHATANS